MSTEQLADLYRILGGLRGDRAILRGKVIQDCLSKELDGWAIKDRLEMHTANLEAEIHSIEGEVAALELLNGETDDQDSTSGYCGTCGMDRC